MDAVQRGLTTPANQHCLPAVREPLRQADASSPLGGGTLDELTDVFVGDTFRNFRNCASALTSAGFAVALRSAAPDRSVPFRQQVADRAWV
jgi:hypothetical protein